MRSTKLDYLSWKGWSEIKRLTRYIHSRVRSTNGINKFCILSINRSTVRGIINTRIQSKSNEIFLDFRKNWGSQKSTISEKSNSMFITISSNITILQSKMVISDTWAPIYKKITIQPWSIFGTTSKNFQISIWKQKKALLCTSITILNSSSPPSKHLLLKL